MVRFGSFLLTLLTFQAFITILGAFRLYPESKPHCKIDFNFQSLFMFIFTVHIFFSAPWCISAWKHKDWHYWKHQWNEWSRIRPNDEYHFWSGSNSRWDWSWYKSYSWIWEQTKFFQNRLNTIVVLQITKMFLKYLSKS